MKRLVVQETTVGGWDVLDANDGLTSLHHSDRIRAEGWARQYSALRGGDIAVVAANGSVLAEYPVNAWARRSPVRGAGRRRSASRGNRLLPQH